MVELVLTDVDDIVLHHLQERARRHGRTPAQEAKAILRKPWATIALRFGRRWMRSTTAWRLRAGPLAIVRTCCVRIGTVERNRRRCQRRAEVVRAGSPCGGGPCLAFRPGPAARPGVLLRLGNRQYSLEESAACGDYPRGRRSDPRPTSRAPGDAPPGSAPSGFGLRLGVPYPTDGLRLPVPRASRATGRAYGNGGSAALQQPDRNALGKLPLLGGGRSDGTMSRFDGFRRRLRLHSQTLQYRL